MLAEPVAANVRRKTVTTGKYCVTSGWSLYKKKEHTSVDDFIIQSCCAFALWVSVFGRYWSQTA